MFVDFDVRRVEGFETEIKRIEHYDLFQHGVVVFLWLVDMNGLIVVIVLIVLYYDGVLCSFAVAEGSMLAACEVNRTRCFRCDIDTRLAMLIYIC